MRHVEEMEKNPTSVTPDDLNNFHRYMPGSDYRNMMQLEDMQEILNRKYDDILNTTNSGLPHSARHLAETPVTFFAIVDEVVTRLSLQDRILQLRTQATMNLRETEQWKDGAQIYMALNTANHLPQEEIRNNQNAILEQFENMKTQQAHCMREYKETLVLIYQELRKMGYSHMDLTE